MSAKKVQEKIYVDENAFVRETDENLLTVKLKNQSTRYFIVDRITMRDVRQRLQKSLLGVLKLDDNCKVDLNQTETILINNKKI